MPLDPARVAELFDEAVELDGADLPAFLDARCGADESLRAALERLLAHDRELAPEFLAVAPVFVTAAGSAAARPRDLVHVAGLLLAVLVALVMGLWRSLRRNRVNRQIAGLLLVSTAAMLLHRVIALRLGTPVPHTLIVDLLLLLLAATVAALGIHGRFALLAGFVLLVTLVAAVDPSRAPLLFFGTLLVLYALGLTWWWRSR